MREYLSSVAATGGLIALVAVALFSGLLVLLHFMKPEIEPSWRMISEYEIGRHGWLMRIAFGCWTVSVVALTIALLPSASTIALTALLIVSAGPIGAAIFATEPITTPWQTTGVAHKLHAAFGALFILGFPVAATLAKQGALGWVPWIGLAAYIGATMFFGARTKKRVGAPDIRIGWPNRLMVASYVVWIAAVAIRALADR